MQGYPHHYHVSAASAPESTVTLSSDGLPDLDTMPPPEFDGPEGYWSPETLLAGSVANCFILTFRAIARASKLEWNDLSCSVEGVLDRVDGVTRFTAFHIKARLTIPEAMDPQRADRVLHKSEAVCLVTASLNTENHLETEIVVV